MRLSMFITLVTIVITALAVVPLLLLWSLNTLFPLLAIPYTFETWLATILLGYYIIGWSLFQ